MAPRIIDHDGDAPGTGGIERWLKLAEGVGLDRAYVQSTGASCGHAFRGRSLFNFVRDRRSSKASLVADGNVFARHHRRPGARHAGRLPVRHEETLAYFTRA